MREEFPLPVDAEQRKRRCIRPDQLRVADARITAVIELLKALMVIFYDNYRAGLGLDGNLSVILIDLDDPSKLLPELAIVKAFWD